MRVSGSGLLVAEENDVASVFRPDPGLGFVWASRRMGATVDYSIDAPLALPKAVQSERS